MEKQKSSINQKQSAALERVYRACNYGGEPSFIVEGVCVSVYGVSFAITLFQHELELFGLLCRFSGECVFVYSPLY
ncbi:MAG TPA: hypothetical protein VE978_13275 [Chitinophagales bacterium]|nr:hypothetical protein [Chitinophagales bacterium]